MIAPLELEWDELLVYHQLYLRCDLSTMIVRYTDRQIEESLRKAKVGRKRIRAILKKFVECGLFVEISKGTRGKNSKPAVGKIVKIKDILGTLNEPNKNLKGTLKTIENTTVYEDSEPNKNLKGTLNAPLIKEKEKENIYSRVITRLNSVAGKSYKPTTKKTITCIDARLKEGFIEDDFYKVIEIKSKEWLGTEYEKYLRPETLFGTKFEGYLNQKTKEKHSNSLEEFEGLKLV